MSAIEKAAAMLREEAEAIKASHTLRGDWCGDPAEADYHEMIAVADAAIAERDALRAKIEAMERQEPVATVDANDEGYWAEILPDRSVRVGQKLYALPGAQSAQSVPDGFALVNAAHFLAVLDREDWRTAKNRAELRAMLAAAPEAKP